MLPANPSSNHHYYHMKQLYPWLTHAFLDRVRYQVACARIYSPHTRISFSRNGSRMLQVIHKGSVYNMDKIRSDPFRYTTVLTSIFESQGA